jgi:hypothetical protein
MTYLVTTQHTRPNMQSVLLYFCYICELVRVIPNRKENLIFNQTKISIKLPVKNNSKSVN